MYLSLLQGWWEHSSLCWLTRGMWQWYWREMCTERIAKIESYNLLNKDTTRKLEHQMNEVLWRNWILTTTCLHSYVTFPRYRTPLRPIVSTIGSFAYSLAKENWPTSCHILVSGRKDSLLWRIQLTLWRRSAVSNSEILILWLVLTSRACSHEYL